MEQRSHYYALGFGASSPFAWIDFSRANQRADSRNAANAQDEHQRYAGKTPMVSVGGAGVVHTDDAHGLSLCCARRLTKMKSKLGVLSAFPWCGFLTAWAGRVNGIHAWSSGDGHRTCPYIRRTFRLGSSLIFWPACAGYRGTKFLGFCVGSRRGTHTLLFFARFKLCKDRILRLGRTIRGLRPGRRNTQFIHS